MLCMNNKIQKIHIQNFGYVGSNIKNCQFFRIVLCFTFEKLQFVSNNSKYRYVF